ncbi:MAG: methionyl-tRNA formyltransferase [Cyanobacteria bacterium NC_groundwater_1444_Ag_S-0.65um_54_12]|nr:methionyl-tRNA formyltransferase [Cyanobacteria bacterium NC_groundwater_1444_Ag_S-0.65um_54_12]
MARLVFMGTPAFAVPSMQALLAAGHEIKLVVTQIDRPAGRGQQIQQSPIKRLAEALGLSLLQPGRLRREPEAIQRLRDCKPDVIVVTAFGQILPPAVLEIPPMGCLNVHGSLLPAYRGAAPVQWALINGETMTGVTIMLMDEGLDTGPSLLSEQIAIAPEDNAGTLSAKLAIAGAQLLVKALDGQLAGKLVPQVQPTEGISLAPLLKKIDGILDWTRPAISLHNQVRGLTPWPGAKTVLAEMPIKILESERWLAKVDSPPGRLVDVLPGGWLVGTGDGAILLKQIQLPGRKAQPAAQAAHGLRQLGPGCQFG